MGKTVVRKEYRLTRPFWDGERLQPVGTTLEFIEGRQPKTAVNLEAEAEAQKAAELLAAERAAEDAAAELEAARALVAAADEAAKKAEKPAAGGK